MKFRCSTRTMRSHCVSKISILNFTMSYLIDFIRKISEKDCKYINISKNGQVKLKFSYFKVRTLKK